MIGSFSIKYTAFLITGGRPPTRRRISVRRFCSLSVDFSERRQKESRLLSIDGNEVSLPVRESEIEALIEEMADKESLKKIFAEISFLSEAYREVMVMYYLEEKKVREIAGRLRISETTVKQRLFSARNIVRKEVKTMNSHTLTLKPMHLLFWGSGNPDGNDSGPKAERMFSQNLIYLCKDAPRTAKELSEELCVPMPYIEEELEIQCRGANGNYGLLRKLDRKLLLVLRAIGGLSVDELDEKERELAAKCIECGYLRKCGDRLEPKMVVIRKEDFERFNALSERFYAGMQDIKEQIAKELAEFMKKRIPKHLINEYPIYAQLIAGTGILSEMMNSCMEEGLLCRPENRLGAEGMLMVVEK